MRITSKCAGAKGISAAVMISVVFLSIALVSLVDAAHQPSSTSSMPFPPPGARAPQVIDPVMMSMIVMMNNHKSDNGMLPLLMIMLLGDNQGYGAGKGAMNSLLLPLLLMGGTCKETEGSDCIVPNSGKLCGDASPTGHLAKIKTVTGEDVKRCCKCIKTTI